MSGPFNVEISSYAVRNALHVNGDPQIDVLLTSVLKPELWVVQHAPSNACAFKLVEAQPYDLIVTSDKKSGKEDIELLRKIQRLRPQTRLIILASESTPADAIAAMREHAFSYFSKPFSLDDLARMMRGAAEGVPCWDDGIEVVSANKEWIRLHVRSDYETADRLLQFLQEIAELPDPERTQLAAASRELLYNAIEHGGKLDPANNVEIDYILARGMVMCRIADPGPGFKFDKIPHAAIANPADDPLRHVRVRQEQGMRPGGYGVLLARRLVDEVIYGRDGNEVLLVKYLHSAAESQSP